VTVFRHLGRGKRIGPARPARKVYCLERERNEFKNYSNRIELHNPLMNPGWRPKTLVGWGVEEGKKGELGKEVCCWGLLLEEQPSILEPVPVSSRFS
jgi:hypothetical protein